MENSRAQTPADAVFSLADEILRRCPSRLAGTPDCAEAAAMLCKRFAQSCDCVQTQTFEMHPDSLWAMGRICALSYVLAAVLLNLGGAFALPGFLVCVLTVYYVGVHYIAYGDAFDGFFAKAKGTNVVASIEPKETVLQQIIVVSHHDAPRNFSFLERSPKWAAVRLGLGALAFLCVLLLNLLASAKFFFSLDIDLSLLCAIVSLAGSAFALPLFGFISREVSPGAGDNLISCALSTVLASRFSVHGPQRLEHTRLVFLSTDGEEVGQRGAANYAAVHAQELRQTPSVVVNIDSLFSLNDLTILTYDRHGTLPLSIHLAMQLQKTAEGMGFQAVQKRIPFGGGGTDAVPFARAGFETTSIVAMPTSLFSGRHLYHTKNDTLAAIEPAVIDAVFRILASFAEQADDISE